MCAYDFHGAPISAPSRPLYLMEAVRVGDYPLVDGLPTYNGALMWFPVQQWWVVAIVVGNC